LLQIVGDPYIMLPVNQASDDIKSDFHGTDIGGPNGIRTRVLALRGTFSKNL